MNLIKIDRFSKKRHLRLATGETPKSKSGHFPFQNQPLSPETGQHPLVYRNNKGTQNAYFPASEL